MGLEQSREAKLPVDIDEQYQIYQSNWNPQAIGEIYLNKSTKGRTTLKPQTLNYASELICEYFLTEQDALPLKILEPFAGNGVATKIIYNELSKLDPNIIIKSTDIQDLSEFVDESSHPVEFGINSVDTVRKYSADGYNVLMMISPPPSTMSKTVKSDYADYFAIKAWEQVPTAKYICFIGELGASDGCEGLYDYMCVNNKTWLLDCREMLVKIKDITGGPCEKELFIFKKI